MYAEAASRALEFADIIERIERSEECTICLVAKPTIDFVIAYIACDLVDRTVILIPESNYVDSVPWMRSMALAVVDGPNVLLCEGGRRSAPWSVEPAEVVFTSGTLGESKAVVTAKVSIEQTTHEINRVVGNKAGDTEIITLPLYRSFGIGRLRCALITGQKIVLKDAAFPYECLLKDIVDHAPVGLAFVPTTVRGLLAAARYDLAERARHISYMEVGSDRLELKHRKELRLLIPSTRIVVHYGMTEASRATLHLLEEHPTAEIIGTVRDGCRMRIKGENGEDVPLGQIGRIWLGGSGVARGFVDFNGIYHPLAPSALFKTTDLGVQDSPEVYRFCGRLGSQFKLRGIKVQPESVEKVFNEIPGVVLSRCELCDLPRGRGQAMVVTCTVDPAYRLVSATLRAYAQDHLPFDLRPQIVKIIEQNDASLPSKVKRDREGESFN